jgi:hypothetical protein
MAQSYVTDAGTLIIPGAYPSIKVQNGASGLSTTGVLFLVGEADGGPDFTQEADLAENAYGPDQAADVVAKYKSGPLVDAFKVASAPANDPDIQGAPNRFILVKTNVSTKASAALSKIGGGTYATLYDKGFGALGNLSYFTVSSKQAEVKPTTGAFTYIPPVSGLNMSFRANGGAEIALALTANESPAAFQAAVDGLASIAASGGANRGILGAVSGNLALAATGNNVVISYSGTWTVTPVAGDTFIIPLASVIDGGAGDQNVGAYVVTAASSNSVSATKLSDAGKPGAVAGTITAPVAVSSVAVAATSDVSSWSPVTITLEGSVVVDGLGKTLEINELTTGVDLFSRCAYVLGTANAVAWVSKSSLAAQLVSAAEYAVSLNVNRQVDNIQEQLSAGGKIALKIGYKGTTASAVVGATTLVITVVGGAGASLSINLKQFPTLSDLATFINSQPDYTAAVGTTTLGQVSPLRLDEGTFGAASTWGNQAMRLKVDATSFFDLISGNSALVQLNYPPATALAGIPDLMPSTTYMAGGAKGSTSDAIYNSAIDALENVKGNFLVPLFSRDASADLADGLTESGSTYTIANVQAYAKSHCLKMSTLKRRKNRQAFLANRGSFSAAENAAANLASFRCSLAFQDVKATGADGIVQFQPWMSAALAAGMQAAGFYRAIVHKGINCSGVLQAAADFKDSSDSNVEDALLAGLLVSKKSDDGGFIWVSDQTTYSKDNNFVYNSIQAVYVADIIALTCAQRMEKAFVGQSVADVSAALALSALEGIMADFLRLKLIAVSDDAPKGFKNAQIKISGTTMVVRVEVKLAGAIYFIPIDFLVSQVTQVAA